MNRPPVVSLVASFTADPLTEPLEFLLGTMGSNAIVVPAPYGQVFQTLLDPASDARRNGRGVVVVAVRMEDFWRAGEANHSPEPPDASRAKALVADLASAIQSAHDATAATVVVCACPASQGADASIRAVLRENEDDLASALRPLSRVRFIGSAELARGMTSESIHDATRERLGHIPFTPVFFARLATAIARRMHGVFVAPRKVIAIDGDNTLWRGIVGEDGVDGVIVDDHRVAFQQFLIEQQRAGMVLCLCSKNNEVDVLDLFARRTEMPLRLDHIVGRRINWERKSENLRSLAEELELGLDSFVFLDDSPVECTEVSGSFPEVLTVQVPLDGSIVSVLNETWALDHWVVTAEDRQRTAMYQQGQARQQVKRAASSLESFIAELGVEVTVAPMSGDQVARVSQLTHRTNQFNCTTIRRSEGEMSTLAADPAADVLVAHVRDRFGDYGLTGVVVARATDAALVTDTFLLSCRVLGRGVEQRILEELARIAVARGLDTIEMPFSRSKRNAPAEQFLRRFDAEFRTDTDDGFIVRVPASQVAELNQRVPAIEAPVEDVASATRSNDASLQRLPATDVAAQLREFSLQPARLVEALAHARKRRRPADAPPATPPTTDVEAALARMWSELLGVEPAGVHDNFFAFGGNSLLATLLLSRVRALLGPELPLRSVFDAPTPAELALLIAGQPQGAERRVGAAKAIPLVAAGAERGLSRGQLRLWVMDRLDGATSALNVPTAFALDGALDVNALRRALIEIARRHQVLRSTIEEHDGAPRLMLAPSPFDVLEERSVEALPDESRAGAARRMLDDEASSPFDLARGPLIRALLVRVSATIHHLIVTMHHIVSDGWSQGVLVRELSALYAAYARGDESPLPELRVQFADYAGWERTLAGARDHAADLAFWRDTLSGAPALAMPTDRPRPSIATYRGAHVHFAWNARLAEAVRALSLREGVTPFITLFAAFNTLLHRYGGQDDVVVGTAVANRRHTDVEPLIGFFVNTLAFRTKLDGDPTFADLLTRVREVALSAQEHDVSFDTVVDAVRPTVDVSRHPLFQAAFVLQNWTLPTLALPGVATSAVTVETAGSQMDLQLSLRESPDGIAGTLEYNRDLYDDARARGMIDSLEAMLRSAVAEPERALSALDLVSPEQAAQLASFSQGDQRPEYLDGFFHRMFESHASATPHAIAVRFNGQSLSYAELNARANRVAHGLMANGVGVESLVGLCVDKSMELVTGMLGILKAGAAFVPLDPRYPRERLRMMLDDSAARVVLVTSESRPMAAEAGAHCIDVVEAQHADVSAANPDVVLAPHNLAYVIYTSGSTGRPKGTLVEHRGLTNMAHYAPGLVGEHALARSLQFASPSFDASVFELAIPLPNGGTVIMPTRDQVQSWPDLLRLLRSERVTCATLPPALLRASDAEVLPDLATLIVAGEASSPELVNAWAPGRRMLNGYGPTEVTVAASFGQCVAGDTRPPTMGAPLPNTQSYVVDDAGRQTPPGVPGELWVGGAGVARGYLNRPDITAQRFTPNPFTGEGRVYRTGDIVRWRPDGTMEFMGRRDDQVKIRGHRVELGEIESVISRMVGVRDVAVVAREDVPGDKRLVAYIVADDRVALLDDARNVVRAELPDYMVPSAIVRMDRFPLSPSGKVDRKALPKPDVMVTQRGTPYVAPRTNTECALAAIWSQVLKVPEVGIEDDFFSLGGDSILSIQVLSRCAKAGIEISAKQLFLTPTIAQLANAARVAVATPVAVTVPVAEAVPEGEVALTPIQHWFFGLDLTDISYWNQAFLFEVPADLDLDRLERALVRVAEHHDALRLRFRKSAGRWTQTYGAAANISLERFELEDATPNEWAARIQEIGVETQEALNISRGPIAAAAHIALPGGVPGRLLLAIHHLAVDGVSWRILLEDIEAAYHALADTRAVALPARTTSYQRWAQCVVERANAHAMLAELAHWRSLAGARGVALPVDGPGGDNLEGSAVTVTVMLTEAETEALLRELPATSRATVHEALLAALAIAVRGEGGDASVLVDVEGHGREPLFDDVDLSRTVGWFTSMYPVALPVAKGGNAADTLRLVKEAVRSVPDKGVGYGMLRELSSAAEARALDELPRADLVFNYLGQFDQVVADSRLFHFAAEETGPWHSPRARRPYAHDVGAVVRNARLELSWMYAPSLHRAATVEAALARFAAALRAMIARSAATEQRALTVTDFPLASLTQDSLDRICAAFPDVEDVYPLSPIQEGLLFHALSAPESTAYLIQSSWTLRGPLDIAAYRQAWKALTDRHTVLRTQFVWEGVEQPVQVVRKNVPLAWVEEDWRALTDEERRERMTRLLEADQRERFDLSRAPLMRLSIVRTGEDTHDVVWTFHHILLDGWSGAIVVQEVAALYEAGVRPGSPVPPQARPYRDYIAQLRRDDPAAEAYWRGRLAGITAPTSLGIDHRVVGATTTSFLSESLAMDATEIRALREFARAHRLTLNTVLQGAWTLVLGCYSGEDDVVFGETVTNRPPALDGVEGMVGLFLNTLPVRARVMPDMLVADWLRDIQNGQGEKSAYESTPLADIQRWSEIARGVELFDSLLVFENYPSQEGNAVHPTVTVEGTRTLERTHYPLTLVIVPGEELVVQAMYDSARFDAEAIRRSLAHLRTVLRGMTASDARHVGDIELLSDSAERALVLSAWNDTAVTYPPDATLVSLLADQVARTPYAVAVEDERTSLTFAALDACAATLAAELVASGATRGSLVGVCADRSVELVIALVAVVKAGAAYVPIDPGYPADRVAFMLQDSGVRAVLTTSALIESLEPLASTSATIIRLDDVASPTSVGRAPLPDVRPDDAAYMIYTSGSTGRPKGALNAHRGIVNRLCWMQSEYGLVASDVVLQKTPFSFDVSVWEFFWPLLAGARLVMARPEGHRDPSYLSDLMARRGVTICHFVPSMLRAFLAEESSASCTSLRDVMASGEALPPDVVATFYRRLPRARLHNLYGPTECAVDVSYWPCPPSMDPLDVVPIGRPVANTQLYVLDSRLRPTPIGVPGELYLAGVQVGMGYHNRPELTAERFVHDPFATSADARMYRTGDRARWRADGTVEYLGRVDFQVKLRGYRIELGEIESVLSQHASVRDATVIVRDDRGGAQRLVAYVVPSANVVLSLPELRAHVGEHLPDYMVPSAFVVLDVMPLSSNGKVDRKALRAPADDTVDVSRSFVAPRTRREEVLAAIWGTALRRAAVGVHDNFFELGGDSILSIQIVARAREAGLPITVASLKKHPTVAELAASVSNGTSPVKAEAGAHGSAPLTPIQRWFFDQDVAERDHWNQTFLFRTAERVDASVLRQAVDALVRHHDALRLRFVRNGAEWEQHFADTHGETPVWAEDLTQVADADLADALSDIAARAATSLDIGDGPVLRAVLVDLGPSRGSRLLLAIHHLVVDGVSWRILLEDMERTYRAFADARPPQLPPRSASYQRWANALVAYSHTNALHAEREFWDGVSRAPLLALPVDGSRDADNTVALQQTVTVSLSVDETNDLLQRVPAAYATQVNDILLTALADALAPVTGRGDLLIDLEGHGREDIAPGLDFSRTVGWFTSLFPFRLPVSEHAELGSRIKATKERLRGIPHLGVGYGILRYLGGAEELREQPAADVIFNYLGQFGQGATGLFQFASEDAGPWVSERGRRSHLLAVNALVMGGRLEFHWAFGRRIHDEAAVRRLADAMCDALRAITRHCLASGAGGRTPSDYPLASLTQAEVDRIAGNGAGIEDVVAVAPMQSLFLATAGSEGEHGFEQQRIHIAGPVDPDAMRDAWLAVLQRHQMLRSDFTSALESGPVQVIRDHADLSFTTHDLTSVECAAQDVRIEDLCAAERARGFSIDAAPLLRLHLLRRNADAWTLVWSHHHLLLDRWSIPVLLGDVGALYRADGNHGASSLAPAPLWSDYIAWMQEQDRAGAEQFWRSVLGGMMPARLPALLGAGGDDGERELLMDAADTALLSAHARQSHTTVNTVISTAWALWLSRATERTDVSFGLAVSGRPDELPGVRTLVGMCINNVPARLVFSAEETTETLVGRLSAQFDAATPHSHASLIDMQRWSGLPWHQRIFDSLVVFHHHVDDATISSWLGDGFGVEMSSGEMQTNYPLTLVVGGGDAIRLRLAYQGRASGPDGADLALRGLADLLRGMISHVSAPANELLERLAIPVDTGAAVAARVITPPRTDTEWVVALIWSELLGLDAIGVDENFFALGGQSLVATQILSRTRDAFRASLPISLLFENPTVSAFAAALTRREPASGHTERIASITRRVEEMSVSDLREAGVHD